MSADRDPFDELAALFLTEPDTPGECETPLARELTTELVVIGHLPVRAGLWLTPYVDAIARQHGPAALIRLDRAGATLEILRASEAGLPVQQPTDLREAIASVTAQISSCMIRCPEPTKPGELIRSGADRITVLSSADEAAVVAAYGIVKDLVEAAEQAGVAPPHLGLAVIGSSDQQATRMIDRLNRTTATFLGVRVPLVACLSRMDAAVRTTRYWQYGDIGVTQPASLVSLLRDSHAAAVRDDVKNGERRAKHPMHEPPSTVSEAPSSVQQPPRREPPVIHVEIPRRDGLEPALRNDPPKRMVTVDAAPTHIGPAGKSSAPAPREHQRPSPARPTSCPEGQTHDVAMFTAFGSAAEPGIRTLKMPPKPAHQLEAKRSAASAEPDEHGQPVALASYINGLTVIDRIRCPGHERVELALDGLGGVHLLAREVSMRELWAVESWFHSHQELIQMAAPQRAIAVDRKVQMHLFTDRPASVADLHHSDLQLYVLAPVHIGDRVAWYFAPLK